MKKNTDQYRDAYYVKGLRINPDTKERFAYLGQNEQGEYVEVKINKKVWDILRYNGLNAGVTLDGKIRYRLCYGQRKA